MDRHIHTAESKHQQQCSDCCLTILSKSTGQPQSKLCNSSQSPWLRIARHLRRSANTKPVSWRMCLVTEIVFLLGLSSLWPIRRLTLPQPLVILSSLDTFDTFQYDSNSWCGNDTGTMHVCHSQGTQGLAAWKITFRGHRLGKSQRN